MQEADFPREYFVELGKSSTFLVGRIIVYYNANCYDSEIDIITKESGKIYKHIGRLFAHHSCKEAVDLSFRKLKLFLKLKEEDGKTSSPY